jgi:photosystem II stability/assembly factor-like uncharacterized protein
VKARLLLTLLPLALLLLGGCASVGADPFARARWQVCGSGTAASLRGLCALDGGVAWASGSGGTVLRTVDGGANWAAVGPPDAQDLDFRSVAATDADHALIASTTRPARVYATGDGGASWRIVHADPDAAAFFDALAFAAPDRGLLLGDPIEERMYLRWTADGGSSWIRLAGASLPVPRAGEASFAASGGCLVGRAPATFVAVTGGSAARCLRSDDGGMSWRAAALPLRQGSAATGAFAVAFGRDDAHLCAVGGDYEHPLDAAGTACWSADGGATWSLAVPGPAGYRCSVAWLRQRSAWLAVGDEGASVSVDDGRTWRTFAKAGFHAVACAPDGAVYAAGVEGRIARLIDLL